MRSGRSFIDTTPSRTWVRLGRAGCRSAFDVLELAAQRLLRTMVKSVDGSLGAAHTIGDLALSEPDKMAKHDDAALVLGQVLERLLEAPATFAARVVGRGQRLVHLLARHGTAPALTIHGHIAGHADHPG